MAQRRSTTRGFKSTANVLSARIKRAGESRGFAVSRLLTHWDSVVGAQIAGIARPVNVTYGRAGFGATLSLLTTGAHAPVLEMQKEAIRARVNATYGYNAISRIRITQTAAEGFAPAAPPAARSDTAPPRASLAAAERVAAPVADDRLRMALARLGANILNKSQS